MATGSDGLQAVELARKHRPDLIVIDYAMPNMDGMEAAEMIIKEMSIPIVLSTGRTDDATLQRARKADIHSYLVKPFHREQLKTAITMAMVRHREKLASEAKIAELQNELTVVKAVDLAASLLMEKFRIDRSDAIEKLETAARARSCSLLDAAKAIAATLGAPAPRVAGRARIAASRSAAAPSALAAFVSATHRTAAKAGQGILIGNSQRATILVFS